VDHAGRRRVERRAHRPRFADARGQGRRVRAGRPELQRRRAGRSRGGLLRHEPLRAGRAHLHGGRARFGRLWQSAGNPRSDQGVYQIGDV
jgi:hypothetical protein